MAYCAHTITSLLQPQYNPNGPGLSTAQQCSCTSGSQNYAYGIGNAIAAQQYMSTAWGNYYNKKAAELSMRLPYIDGKIPDEAIKLEVTRFVETHQDLINNNKFGDFYYEATKFYCGDNDSIYKYKFMISEFQKLFQRCKIDDLSCLEWIPDFYLCGQHIYEFEIPGNIRSVKDCAFRLCPNLNNIIWKCKQPTSSPGHAIVLLPSINTMENLYTSLSSSKVTINFIDVDVNYNSNYINDIKKCLKEMKKQNKNHYNTKISFKFKDKKKEIRIIQ